MKKFNEQECMDILRQLRWGGELRCANCKSSNIAKYGKDRKGFIRYICKDCRKGFNEKTGTIFDRSQIAIEDWFRIIGDCGRKSLMKISKEMNKPYNTIHACAKKIKADGLANQIRITMDNLSNQERKHEIHHTHHIDYESIKQHEVHRIEAPVRKAMNRKPRVLMIGWEFYPKMVGGLGKVCYELAKALKDRVELNIILPIGVEHPDMKIISANVSAYPVRTLLGPYLTEKEYMKLLNGNEKELYGWNMFEESERFAERCREIAAGIDFDIIHVHDWMTFRAGIKIKEASGKPLVLHVHTTEMDRGCGLGVNKRVFDLEKEAFEKADMIFAVSDFTRNKIMQNYGIDSGKVKVIHNAIESGIYEQMRSERRDKGNKVVLYFGRITMHKGPDYFLRAARKVVDNYKNVTFVMAGTGDMLTRMMELSCHMGLGNKVLFTGYLSEEESREIYKMADIYIMSSVSEPFGLTALEAMASGVPTILTKSCGVGEVVNNCFKVDFWDTDEMANKIISFLKFPSLSRTMSENCIFDVKKNDWNHQADRCVDYYSHIMI